jgi:hypothetical protein
MAALILLMMKSVQVLGINTRNLIYIYIYIYIFAFLLYYYCLRNYILYNGIYMFSNSLHPQSRALKKLNIYMFAIIFILKTKKQLKPKK